MARMRKFICSNKFNAVYCFLVAAFIGIIAAINRGNLPFDSAFYLIVSMLVFSGIQLAAQKKYKQLLISVSIYVLTLIVYFLVRYR